MGLPRINEVGKLWADPSLKYTPAGKAVCELPIVEWRPVLGFEGWYEVSNTGQVRRVRQACGTRAGKILKPSVTSGGRGYEFVNLSKNGVVSPKTIHRMVLQSFAPPPDDLEFDALHRDGNPRNNNIENLYWGTVSDNLRDSVRHGTHRYGSRLTCDKGHEYSVENTHIRRDSGARKCRTCMRDQGRAARAKRKTGVV